MEKSYWFIQKEKLKTERSLRSMSLENYYRIIVGNKGIYEAVDNDCPKNDPKRKQKPDGSWLPKIGQKYIGAISFWKEEGLKKYIESKLLQWHLSVVKGEARIITIERPKRILYEDNYQVVCGNSEIMIRNDEKVRTFLRKLKIN